MNLIEFAAGQMTQSRARASKIVRCQLVDVAAARGRSDDISEHLRRHPVALNAPGGTALVVHAKPDDMKSGTAGNAWDRIACGLITK